MNLLELFMVYLGASLGSFFGVGAFFYLGWRAARKYAAVQTLSQLGAEQRKAESGEAKPKTLRLVTDEGSAS
ncbi:hypothetical protein ACNQS7_11995 [Mycobacterium sp. 23]